MIIRPHSVYIAASSKETLRARSCAAMLRAEKFEVTSTWWVDVEATDDPNPPGLEYRKRYSEKDLKEVSAAQVLWLLVPESGVSHGAFFEAGFAVGSGSILVASGRTDISIFCSLAHKETVDDSTMVSWLSAARRNGVYL